jgi:hypothetical protein
VWVYIYSVQFLRLWQCFFSLKQGNKKDSGHWLWFNEFWLMKMVLYCSTDLFDSVSGLFTIKHCKMGMLASLCPSVHPSTCDNCRNAEAMFMRFFCWGVWQIFIHSTMSGRTGKQYFLHSVKPYMCSYVKLEYNFPSNFQNIKWRYEMCASLRLMYLWNCLDKWCC